MMKKILNFVGRAKSIEYVNCSKAPEAVGPYVHATKFGEQIWVSGQIGLDESGDFVGDEVGEQATQCLINMKNILEECGSGMESVVKVTVLLTDMNDFQEVNEIYGQWFGQDGKGFPARACYEVSALPKGGKIEIEAMAVKEDDSDDL